MRVVAWFPPLRSGGESTGGKRLRYVSRHFSHPGLGGNATRYFDTFKWKNPHTLDDGEKGGICARSGCWFPAHMMTVVDGERVGLPFAPNTYPTYDLDR